MWHVLLTRTCVGAIQEHTVLTCFKHFSCDMKLHTAGEKKERDLEQATEIRCIMLPRCVGIAALAKENLTFFLSSPLTAQCDMS